MTRFLSTSTKVRLVLLWKNNVEVIKYEMCYVEEGWVYVINRHTVIKVGAFGSDVYDASQ